MKTPWIVENNMKDLSFKVKNQKVVELHRLRITLIEYVLNVFV